MKQAMRLIASVVVALAVTFVLIGQIDAAVAKYMVSSGKYERFQTSQTLYSLSSAMIVLPAFLMGGLIAKRYFLPVTVAVAPILAMYGLIGSADWHGTTVLDELKRSWPSVLASVLASILGASCGVYLRNFWFNRKSRDAA